MFETVISVTLVTYRKLKHCDTVSLVNKVCELDGESDVNINDNSIALNSEIAREINDINLAYILLAQKMVKQDKAASMIRLGIGAKLADMLANMSITQIIKLSNSKFLIFSPRLDDEASIHAVGNEDKDSALQRAHMSILMAGRHSAAKNQA